MSIIASMQPLPSERLGIAEPLALRLKDLLYDVAGTSAAAVAITDIYRDGLHLRSGILGAARAPCPLHNLIVRYVVAHIYHLVVMKSVLDKELIPCLYLDGAVELYVLDA